MKKVMMIAALAAVLTACGGANDGDATTDTTSTMPPEPMTIDSNTSSGSTIPDSLRDTSSGFSSSPSNPSSRTSTPGGNTNQNDSTRQ